MCPKLASSTVPARIGECMNSGMCLSGNIRTRENSVSQIGMKPGRHITGNARRRECNEKCKDDWILVKTLTNQLICVQFPFVACYYMGIRVPLPCNMCYFLGVASHCNRFYVTIFFPLLICLLFCLVRFFSVYFLNVVLLPVIVL